VTGGDDLDACAAIVRRGDPDRFRALLAAPRAARSVLLPLYAFNMEVARAPWVTAEPMIAEIRLQWWRDALEEIAAGGEVRRHEVATPLSGVIDGEAARILDRLVAARRWDCHRAPFTDAGELDAYIGDTASGLMWVAARALGARTAEPVVAAGRAAGIAAFLLAVPALRARGRQPLPAGTPPDMLARAGLDALRRARQGKAAIPPAARPALLPGWRAADILTRAASGPERVADGTLAESEARKRLRLLIATARGMI